MMTTSVSATKSFGTSTSPESGVERPTVPLADETSDSLRTAPVKSSKDTLDD